MTWFELMCVIMTAGMIVGMILLLIFAIIKNNDKEFNKNIYNRNNSNNNNSISNNRDNWSNSGRLSRISSNEKVIEDLIICDMLGIL